MVYTTFTSTFLSLLLGFRLLRRRVFPSTTTNKDARNVIALYEGTLHHERRHPIRNSFRFLARYALIDLDRPPYSPPTFISADEARRAAETNGPVVMELMSKEPEEKTGRISFDHGFPAPTKGGHFDTREMELTTSVALITPLIIFFVFIKKWQKSEAACGGLPPGPKKLPIIGDLHLISQPYFRCLRDLAIQYGPIMHLKLGEVDTVVISSPEIAKEILKDNDPIFTDRPESIALKIFWYNYIDITFHPYGEYWKQMRNICIAQLTSTKSVRSFTSIRRDEVARLLHSVRLSAGSPVNLTEKIFSLMSTVICRAEFGMPCYDEAETLTKLQREALEMSSGFLIADMFPSSKIAGALSWGTKLKLLRMRRELDVILDDIIHHHQTDRRGSGDEDLVDVLLRVKESGELKFPIGHDNIKAVLLDMFSGGNETSSSTVNWAMAELLRNPEIMAKVQAEVRQVVNARSNNNNSIEAEDVQTMKYLKLVIMETHRLHPTISVIPRVSREACQISGYDIPKKLKVLVNVWAIQRDPKYWPDPETFKPERFQNQSSLDFNGNDFRYLPFGSGKRVCPGTLFGSAIVALTLAHLLYEFNWKLPQGVDAQALDMTENYGIATSRREHLFVVATPYQLSP